MKPSRYLIAGIGKTGYSIARYLQRKNKPFVVFDTRTDLDGLTEFEQTFPTAQLFLGSIPEEIYGDLIAVIASPGVSLDQTVMKNAHDDQIPIYGDIECLVREINSPVIAITGTNGKSTVTTLVGEMAKTAGIKVAVAGNIGQPVLDLLDDLPGQYELWVLELSSFQLELTQSLAAVAATILNVSPDHLDRHHTFSAYVGAKQRIYQHAGLVLYNRADQATVPVPAVPENTRMTSFGLDQPESGQWGLQTIDETRYLAYGKESIISVDALRIKGKHNWANALAACALAHSVGISFDCMKQVLQQFPGLPHRTQWVRTLNEVDWINDSKGTNIGATISAISGIGHTLRGKIVLIAGGQGKGADFKALRPVMNYIRSVVLIGEDADKLADALGDIVAITRTKTLEEAVNVARISAKPGDVVLLSPACASLDMFDDFNHRGDVFCHAVNLL